MSEAETEQQELPQRDGEDGYRSFRDWVLGLYGSENVFYMAAGFWLKFLIESAIVFGGFLIFYLIASLLIFYEFIPISYIGAALLMASFTATVTLSVWCFSGRSEED